MIIAQLVMSILLMGLILLQKESSGAFTIGGVASSYGAKRGAEKTVFLLTIIIGILFIILSLLNAVASS